LAGETSTVPAEQKPPLWAGIRRSEIDARRQNWLTGAWIEVVRQPLWAGGWLATHEDITSGRKLASEQARRNLIERAISSFPHPGPKACSRP